MVEENRQAPYLHGAKSPVEERDIKQAIEQIKVNLKWY